MSERAKSTRPGLDAVVLAGGGGRRMGGVDKPGLTVGGSTLVERVAGVVRSHSPDAGVTVVGPPRESPRARYVREDPPGSGPVPALRAGLPYVEREWFALLAADLPHLTPGHLDVLADALREGTGDTAGAVFVDDDGREQWLTGIWRTAAVREALGNYRGRSLYGLLGPLSPRLVPLTDRHAAFDVDTPDDLARARRDLEGNLRDDG
ncbi:molybdenum cofactor guanylyltransferase [Nocardiopsis aegyptia]|uniref:Molybdopterin-guanine dinucleotide biosynthesis protein A n=1 Tax=Nocardiopsis aegyptia TaxID=220378 RepID=A0A7Z0EJC6_9ACTN|nr:NTP transferase domain-containing protein [Nocardiopsis aegyptia]NYJ33086.1 molybdopterin-guanine dinucleotide biosynthesis protein A [Nocardiopsis aegyptia]